MKQYTDYEKYIPTKTSATYYGASYRAKIQKNRQENGVQEEINHLVNCAAYWRNCSYDEIYDMVKAPEVYRCHTMESGLPCPACHEMLGIYEWVACKKDAFKVMCPKCHQRFPDNDFDAFYRSGLDEKGHFVRENANADLLVGEKYIDDGNGWNDPISGKTYWFVGYWLIHGLWQNHIMPAVKALSMAYSVTEDIKYARRVGILLDRLADFFPVYDFNTQGVMYGNYLGNPKTTKFASVGSFAYSIDNAFDVKDMAHAYDRVFEGLQTDEGLVAYLECKKSSGDKSTFAKIQKNIETNIFRYIISTEQESEQGAFVKMTSNAPALQNAIVSILMVLDANAFKEDIAYWVEATLRNIVKCDGLTIERGLLNYMRMNFGAICDFVFNATGNDLQRLQAVVEKCPDVARGYRFFVDLWTRDRFYPGIGDSHAFDVQTKTYARDVLSSRSVATFLWQLFHLTKDPSLAQILYIQNPQSPALVLDIGFVDVAKVNGEIAQVIKAHGKEPLRKNAFFPQLGIGIVHLGTEDEPKSLWFNTAGPFSHGHQDALGVGLYAYGINLLPDLGYPPVNYEGNWGSKESVWYRSAMSHHTFAFFDAEGKEISQQKSVGSVRLMGEGTGFAMVSFEAANVFGVSQADRIVSYVEMGNGDRYLLDIGRLKGENRVKKFFHPAEAKVLYEGITLNDDTVPAGWLVQNYKSTSKIKKPWSADFALSARAMRGSENKNIHVKYTDLTQNVDQVAVFDSFLNYGFFDVYDPTYKPAIALTVDSGKAAFVSVIEPYQDKSKIAEIKRFATSDFDVAVEVTHKNGMKDLHVVIDKQKGENKRIVVADWNLTTDAEMVFVRKMGDALQQLVVVGGTKVSIGKFSMEMTKRQDFVEIVFVDGVPKWVQGDMDNVKSMW